MEVSGGLDSDQSSLNEVSDGHTTTIRRWRDARVRSARWRRLSSSRKSDGRCLSGGGGDRDRGVWGARLQIALSAGLGVVVPRLHPGITQEVAPNESQRDPKATT